MGDVHWKFDIHRIETMNGICAFIDAEHAKLTPEEPGPTLDDPRRWTSPPTSSSRALARGAEKPRRLP
jgi:hypothetical protein